MLGKAGTLIRQFLLTLFMLKLVIVLFQFMILQSITLDECLQRLVLFMIPTEVTIVETLAAYPIAMLIVLFLHEKYVRA
jgi:hypothetical protein